MNTLALVARTRAPRDHLDRSAAIGERASRIVQRVLPQGATPHGFYDPVGFLAACEVGSRRARLYRELCQRLAVKEMCR